MEKVTVDVCDVNLTYFLTVLGMDRIFGKSLKGSRKKSCGPSTKRGWGGGRVKVGPLRKKNFF